MEKIDASKTQWDLTPLFENDNDPKIEEIRELTKKQSYEFINKWKNRKDYLEDALVLKEALDEYEKLSSGSFGKGEEGSSNTEGYYFWLRTNQEQLNSDLKAKYNKAEEFTLKIKNDLEFFELNIGKISRDKQKEFLKDEDLTDYKHFLKRIFEKSKYFLTENEEKIMNLKSATSYENWVKLVDEFLSKEEKEVLTKKGTKELKNIEEILSLLRDENKEVRDSAAKAFNEILNKHKELAEAEINAVLKDKKVNDEIRKMPYPEFSRLLSDDIEKEVVDTLIKNVSSKFEISKRYYQLKAKLLGVEKLAYHERRVSIGDSEKEYLYSDAVNLVYNVFKSLDPEFAKYTKELVEEGKIDVFPKKGKRGGAFCVYWLKNHPTFILLNHNNKLNDVKTLAHELGHAINNIYVSKNQNSLYYGTSIATAEVASTFMEDFVLQKILSEANDELKLTILMQKLDDEISTIFRQVAGYMFERELHDEFYKKGHLSSKEIGEIFSKHMANYMGEYVNQDKGSENWWIYWRHFRMFFYVYSYASGLLISKSLQRNVRKNPESIEKVKEFLSTGISLSPKETFSNLGIDITDDSFWREGIKEIEDVLDEAESLAKKLNKI